MQQRVKTAPDFERGFCCFDKLLTLRKNRYALPWASRRASSAAVALGVIDGRVVVGYCDSAVRALFLADFAADAAVLADVLCHFSRVL